MADAYATHGRHPVARVPAPGDVGAALDHALKLLGGLERALRPGDRVLVKPDAWGWRRAPHVTPPDVVSAVAARCVAAGARHVLVADNGAALVPPGLATARAGLAAAARAAGPRVAATTLGERGWVPVDVEDAGGETVRRLRVAREVLDVDRVVIVTTAKTRPATDVAMSLHGGLGAVHPADRLRWRAEKLRDKVAEMNLALPTDLVVVDARLARVSGGALRGRLAAPGVLLASGDRVAADVAACRVIQSVPGHGLEKDPWRYRLIARAAELGLGARTSGDVEVRGA